MKMPILAILAHFWPAFGLLRPLYQYSNLSVSIFVLVLTRLSEIYKKIWTIVIFEMKISIQAILAQFWPIFGLLWPHYQFSQLSISIFDLILTEISEIG